MDPIPTTFSAAQLLMSIASSRGPSRPIFPFRSQGSSNWPLPVIGFLRRTPAAGFAFIVDALRQGLNDAGFVEFKNVAIEYHWADNQQDRLPALAACCARAASGPAAAAT